MNLEMYSEIVIERVCRSPGRPQSCELGGRDRASLKIRTWRSRLREFGGRNRARL